jgi:hypothetical protein
MYVSVASSIADRSYCCKHWLQYCRHAEVLLHPAGMQAVIVLHLYQCTSPLYALYLGTQREAHAMHDCCCPQQGCASIALPTMLCKVVPVNDSLPRTVF